MKIAILDDTLEFASRPGVLDRLCGHDVTVIHEHIEDVLQLASQVADAQVLVLNRERTPIATDLIDRLPVLKLISQTGQAIPHIDVPACTMRGIVVCAGGRAPLATVELTWALILASRRRIVLEANQLRHGRWQSGLGATVRNRTLGVFGYGTIGSGVANLASAFGMNVLVWGREGSLARATHAGFETASGKAELFARSDVLTIHLHLNEATRGIIRASDLAEMKPTALIVNSSRAALFEPGSLLAALRAGRPGFAAVDVFDNEPVMNGSDPLLQMDNVLCTPHIGHVETDAYQTFYGIAIDQIVAFVAGAPINVVNPDVLR